jgi:hypothetical protein
MAETAKIDGLTTRQREQRLRRREILLAELAEARALRRRLTPRRARLARENAVLRAAHLRR